MIIIRAGMSAANEDDAGQELTVLICSANVGNAEPTLESFAQWIPADGEIAGPLLSTRHPVVRRDDGCPGDADDDPASRLLVEIERELESAVGGVGKGRGSRRFDMIVIGMQEAAFLATDDGGGKSGTPLGESTTDPDIPSSSVVSSNFPIIDGVSEIKREGKRHKKKVSLMLRSLGLKGHSSPTVYKR
jgi:hypothetical protein